jgi:chromate reductase
MRVLAISGSLRADSHNARLLRHAAERAPVDVTFELFEGLRDIPPYDQDHDVEPCHPAVRHLRHEIAGADALLIATPEYNASIPGVLKNAIDWASRPVGAAALTGKPAAVIGATTGIFGAVWAQADLRKVLSTAGVRVIESELPVAKAHEAFDATDALRDPALTERLDEILEALCAPHGAAALQPVS